MLKRPLHQLAVRLLRAAIRVAPPEIRAWGNAMLAELPHIESAWTALSWALGGSIVLAKHAVASMFGFGRRNVSPGGGLFARRISLRKTALASSGIFVLASLLFFAAPPFRQGLRVSLAPWTTVWQPATERVQARIGAIGNRAEAQHDADGLVFAAVRISSGRASARWVDEAVRMDPNFIWAYTMVAMRHPEIPEIRQWIPALEHWRPDNALFPLIAAESIRVRDGGDSNAAWRQAMAAAFASSKFDDYLDQLQSLDRRVARKYSFNNSQELLVGEQMGLPERYFSDARDYAASLLESGERLGARGNWKGAEAEYWSVARFGEMMDLQVHENYGRWAGATLQWMAYRRLKDVALKQGNTGEAGLLTYLGKKFDPATGEAAAALQKSVFGNYVARRNAFVLQVSALLMLVFSGLLISAAVVLIAASRPREISRRSKRGTAVFAVLTSAVGLLLSSATVYLTYRPYWYILQSELLKGDTSQTSGLRSFLAAMRTPPGLDRGMLLELPVYFWAGVILAATAVLMLIFLRHFREPLAEPQPDSHVQ